MPHLLVFCVLCTAVVREPSMCDRKIQKLGCMCVCVCVCARACVRARMHVCMCTDMCCWIRSIGISLRICGLTWELIIDGFIYSECDVNPKLACKANERKSVSLVL